MRRPPLVTAASPARLAALMTRRLAAEPWSQYAALELARALLRMVRRVPGDAGTVILGGSLARGEPYFRRVDGRGVLVSDIDLLLVRERHTTFPVDAFVADAAATLPTITMMSVGPDEYRRLGTSLGHDFKNLGVPLNRGALPAHDPVVVTPADAHEVFLFAIVLCLLDRIVSRAAAGDGGPELTDATSRVVMKALRSSALLHSVFDGSLPYLRRDLARLTAEEWAVRRGERADDVWRLVTVLRTVRRHVVEARGGARDAVTGTVHDGAPGSAEVAATQRLVGALLDGVLTRLPSTSDAPPGSARLLADATRRAWTAVAPPDADPERVSAEDFVAGHVATFRARLLQMKVAHRRRIGCPSRRVVVMSTRRQRIGYVRTSSSRSGPPTGSG